MRFKVGELKNGSCVARRALLVFLGMVLGFNVYLTNAQTVTRNQMPTPFGIGIAVVQTGSMEPALHAGDLLFVKPVGDYDLGDIVVYPSGNSLVVHRIVGISGTTLTTQGDANNTPDTPFQQKEVLGKVVFSVAGLGYVFEFLKTPLGMLMIAGIAIALVELSFRHDKKLAEKDDKEALKREIIKEEIRQLKIELGKM